MIALLLARRLLRGLARWLRRRRVLAPAVLPAGARLTTYNIGRGAKGARGARVATLGKVAATVAAERPDVVCLQEVHEPDVGVMVAALAAEHDLAYEAHFVATVPAAKMAAKVDKARARDDFDVTFWEGRDTAYGIALLSRAPLVDVRDERLPGDGEPRFAIVARTAMEGTEVTVIATHVAVAEKAAERDLQTAAVLALAGEVDGPVVVAGDLNQDSGDVTRALRNHPGLTPATDPTVPTLGPLRAIDHVLVGPGVTVAGALVGDRGVSDHNPVTVSLRL